MKLILLEKGATEVLSTVLLTEEVLPDSTPRDAVIDTLRYKLKWCAPSSSLTIIDPYLYPDNPDPDYESHFLEIFGDSIKTCSVLTIVTGPRRNRALESQLDAVIGSTAPQAAINKKYSTVFHDRFWIADDSRGVFVGTSLNGIGRRYAIIDYLRDEDVVHIAQRVRSIP